MRSTIDRLLILLAAVALSTVLLVTAACGSDSGRPDSPPPAESPPLALCTELEKAVAAGEDLEPDWETEPLIRTSEELDNEDLRSAVQVFADAVRDLVTGQTRVSPLVYQSSVDYLAWWSAEECEASINDSVWYDVEKNPSGLTVATPVPLTQGAAAPSVALYANADRTCFALGRYVEPFENDYLSPEAIDTAIAAAGEANSRVTCAETGDQPGLESWSGTYEGWQVKVVPSSSQEVGSTEREPLTETLDVTVGRI